MEEAAKSFANRVTLLLRADDPGVASPLAKQQVVEAAEVTNIGRESTRSLSDA